MINYSNYSIPMIGSLDTKTNNSVLLPHDMERLENGDYTNQGEVQFRKGYSKKLKPGYYNYGNYFNHHGDPYLVTSWGSSTIALTTGRVFASTSKPELTDQGSFVSGYHEYSEVASAPYTQLTPDCAVSGNIAVYVWASSTTAGEIRCTIADNETGAVYRNNLQLVSANARFPSAIAVGESIIVLWHNTSTNNIDGQVLLAHNIDSSFEASSVTIRSDAATNGVYAISKGIGNNFFLVYDTDNSVVTGTAVCSVSQTGASSTPVQVSASHLSVQAIAYNSIGNQIQIVGWEGTNVVVNTRAASDLTTISTSTDATASVVRSAVCAVTAAESSAAYFAYAYEISAASPSNHRVVVIFEPNVGNTVRHSYIAAKPFTNAHGHATFVLGHDSRTGIQNTYYFCDNQGAVTGALMHSQAGDVPATQHLPNFNLSSIGIVTGVLPYRTRTETTADDIFAGSQFNIRRIDVHLSGSVTAAQSGQSTYIGGNQLWQYDGVSVFEAGFHMFPDMLDADVADSAAGSLSAGIYNYRVYYEWFTVTGERIRSAAIAIQSPTLAANRKTTLTIPTLAQTRKRALLDEFPFLLKPPRRSEVSIVIYRTIANGSDLYFRVSSVDPAATGDNGFLLNTIGSDTVSFTDNMTDATLQSQEQDYLSFSELANFNTFSPRIVTAIGPRLYLAGGSVPRGCVLPSKERTDGNSIAISGDNLTLVNQYEKITTIQGLNEQIVVFSDNRIYLMGGQGFTNTGAGTGWSVTPVTTDVGCQDPRTVVEYPKGLLFHSDKGKYGLSQGFEVSYVGAPVEKYNSDDCVGAAVIPDTNLVIFVSTTGRAQVYDYFYNKWTTYTNHYAVGCVAFGDNFVYLRNSGDVYVRDPSMYSDAGTPYEVYGRTGKARIVQGVQEPFKVRRVTFLGKFFSNHRLKIGIIRNRDESPVEEFTFLPATVIDDTLWGEDVNWGDMQFWGGSFGSSTYQFSHRPEVSKYETIAFEFTSTFVDEPGPSFTLTEIMLSAGPLRGDSKLSAARRF